MSTPLIRVVLRVPAELPERLTVIAEHLYDETRLEYSFAAIIRGLIALGLEKIEGKTGLAVEFAGARVPRGRKAGSTLDLTKNDVDPATAPSMSNWERRDEERKREAIQRFDDIADAIDAREARKAKGST